MPLTLLHALQRKKAVLGTLQKMLANVDEVLRAFADETARRELTADELNERAALEVRRDRISKSISEAESSSSSQTGGRRG